MLAKKIIFCKGHSVKQLALFEHTLSKKPYCTNEVMAGLMIRSKSHAVKHRYIQHNQPNSISWLVIDVDHEHTYIDDLNPAPNMVAYNPENGRCHAFYALDTPVHKNFNSSFLPQKYFTAIQYALTKKLGGDQAYSGLICKNPLNAHWRVQLVHDELWELGHLAEYLDLTKEKVNENYEEAKNLGVGFGRNCVIFEVCREWSYKAVREFLEVGCGDWLNKVRKHCHELNNDFKAPLSSGEVDGISKSIANYVWRKRNELTDFSKQSARGKASGKVRLAKSEEKRAMALEMSAKGIKQKEIAESLCVTVRTVRNWTKSKSGNEPVSDSSPLCLLSAHPCP